MHPNLIPMAPIDFGPYLAALKHQPMTVAQLADALGYQKRRASRAIRQLRDKRLVRVLAWWKPEGGPGQLAPVFCLADGQPDAPQPPFLTPDERYAYRQAWIAAHRDRKNGYQRTYVQRKRAKNERIGKTLWDGLGARNR
jgi:DNA-binding transcriptional ArsR family regulator